MKRGVMLVLAAGLLGGLTACGSTQPERVESSLNLPQKPDSSIPAVASVGPTSGPPSSISGDSRFSPAMFPATPDSQTRKANQQAIEDLKAAPITPGDVVTPVTTAP